jgi:hypothetical protein
MENRRRTQPFCGDTFNSLARDNKKLHYSTSYKWFLKKSTEEKKRDKHWTTRLVNVGCVPKFFSTTRNSHPGVLEGSIPGH